MSGTWRFWMSSAPSKPGHYRIRVFTVSAPTWYLAHERARVELGDGLAWELVPKLRPDVTLEYEGNAASNPSTLRIVERKRGRK